MVAPLTLLVVYWARPTAESLFFGALVTLVGEGIRLWSIGYTGEPTRSQDLEAPALVTSGPYSVVRNPLYLGNLLNGMAVALAACGGYQPLQAAGLVTFVACSLGVVYGSIIPLEEEFLEERFGEQYRDYCRQVGALLPRSLGRRAGEGSFSLETALRFERTSLMWLVVVWAVLCLKLS